MTPAAFRKLVLALEGVEERPHFDRAAFRTKRRTFATLGGDAQVNMMVEPVERRDGLLEAFPDTFSSLGGWTRLGFIAVDLRRVDDDLLRELVVDAWRESQPRTKAKRAAKADPASDRLAGAPAPTRAIVEAARATIRAAAPKDVEEIACAGARPKSSSMMWKLVRYASGGEVVVTIGTFSKHASIFFARGAELPDPQQLLEGAGKALRYLTLRAPSDASRPAALALVRAAFALTRPASARPARRPPRGAPR